MAKRRCKGRLHLESMAGQILVRRADGRIHGYCAECRVPVELRYARHYCNRLVEKS